MRSVLKKIPGARKLHDWLSRTLFSDSLQNEEILRGFINGNGWLFSQPKTGTNLISSSIAFYNAETLGLSDYGFDDRYRLGMVHGGSIIKSSEGIQEALSFQELSTRMMIVRWHDDVPGACPRLVICTTRGLLDQLTSLWHYKYRPMGVSVENAIPTLVELFVQRDRHQFHAVRRAEDSVVVSYENLIADPHKELSRILKKAYGDVDGDALERALRHADKKNFKKWESERGAPAISKDLGKYESSFIRSGRIGEGAEFFSDGQKSQIWRLVGRLTTSEQLSSDVSIR